MAPQRRVEADAGVLERPGAGEGTPQGGRSRPVPPPPMRVVFDSNVLLAALLFPEGRAEAAVANILGGVDDLVISRPIIQEILSVLASKFSRDKEELSRVAGVIGDMGRIVELSRRLSVLRDEPDNRILECAVEGNAEAIVTGDKAMLAIGEYEGIRLMMLADYLKKPGRGGKGGEG